MCYESSRLDTFFIVTISMFILFLCQASDGQHIYLHPLNARCLLQHNGSYARCPATISAKILESEEFSMSEVSLLSSVTAVTFCT